VVTPANATVTAFVFIGPRPATPVAPAMSGRTRGIWRRPQASSIPANFPAESSPTPFRRRLSSTAPTGYGIELIADNGIFFTDKIQTVVVDNVVINDTTYTFESGDKEDCKNGGWKNFTSPPGPFKNQGDCVSYFASGGKNQGDGH